jgi:pimeloyl-ACP methyl ester carboxylesterase
MRRYLRRFGLIAASLVVVVGVGAPQAVAEQGSSSPGLVNAVPGLADLKLPAGLASQPNGLPNGPLRDYGTPTPATDKACPFTGKIPVNLPIVASPVGSPVPGLAGLNLTQPSVATHVYGELCMSRSALARTKAGNPPAILVLVHGITYGTWYWDLPYQPDRYSTVNYLIRHGYATLNLDRIGDGRSDHPLSPLVSAPSQAEVVHQLVGKLKAGKIGSARFAHVGLVGHSYGTVINWIESALYNDTDVDIGTGYSDRVNPVTAGSFIALSTPALASPIQKNQPWAIDPGYLQPLPTARGIPQLFYTSNADPGVIATDVRLANTVTVGEVGTFVEREYDGTHKNIRIPTFSIQGQYDIMTCGDQAKECTTDATTTDSAVALERKAQRYTDWQSTAMSSQACFRGAVVPDAAHDITLHRNAEQFHAQVAFFADQAMGTQGQNVAHYKQTCARNGPTVFDTLPELNRLVPPFPVAPPPLESIVDPIVGALPLPK